VPHSCAFFAQEWDSGDAFGWGFCIHRRRAPHRLFSHPVIPSEVEGPAFHALKIKRMVSYDIGCDNKGAMKRTEPQSRFVVCVNNKDYPRSAGAAKAAPGRRRRSRRQAPSTPRD
jgi:hypothetical protein